MTRQGEQIRIAIPPDALAFQIGESAQIVSGGVLQATPHCVKSAGLSGGVSRNTFALFMEPNNDVVLKVPQGAGEKDVFVVDKSGRVPPMLNRFSNGCTFGDFEKKTLSQYYEF